MAYTDDRSGANRRVATATMVAFIQGAAVLALVHGLAVTFVQPKPIPNPQSTDVPLTVPIDPPPPEPQKLDAQPRDTTPTATRLPIDLPIDQRLPLPETTLPVPQLPPIDPIARPDPLPSTPAYTPRSAKPRNAPGTWATTNDYPTRDIREGNEGVVGFLLAIDAEGRVTSCSITRSSGHPGLDAATCDKVSRRARFEAATDETGARVAGNYSGSIRWRIPQD